MSCKSCGPTQSGTVDEINGPSQDLMHPVTPCGQGCPNPGLQPACCEPISQCAPAVSVQPWGTPALVTPTTCSPVRPCGTGACTTLNPCCVSRCCTPPIQANPRPYYTRAQACTEDHSTTIINENFDAALNVANSWNVPACGGASTLSIPGLSDIVIGSYLWHPTYGYYQVLAFNPSNSQVVVQNNCTANNAAIGTQIPACTAFVVTDPPASSSGGGGVPTVFPYLAVDFTAPSNGVCIPITVTTTQGLSVGKNVSIGTGTYGVSAITSATQMTICNNGLGAVPGSPVLARDSAGNLQYPVILIDANPCTNTPITTTGAIIACNSNTQAPLTGAIAGMIPVLVDPLTGEAQYRAIDFPTRTCTALAACLTLAPAQTNTLLVVADTSVFAVGDILQLGNTATRLTVTSIVDATHMYADISPVPAAFVDYPIATSLCIADCCEQAITTVAVPPISCQGVGPGTMVTLFNKVGNVLNFSSAPEHYSFINDIGAGSAFAPINIVPVGVYTAPLPAVTLTITNPSPCRTMFALVGIRTSFKLRLSFTNVKVRPSISVDGGPASNLFVQEINAGLAAGEWTQDYMYTSVNTISVLAGTARTVTIQGIVEVDLLGNASPSAFEAFGCTMSVLGSTST